MERRMRGARSFSQTIDTSPIPGRASFPAKTGRRTAMKAPLQSALFPRTGMGCLDVIGNVWEWTVDWYVPKHPAQVAKTCCIPHNPRGGRAEESCDPRDAVKVPRRVVRRLAPVCTELLPPLSAGGTPSAAR